MPRPDRVFLRRQAHEAPDHARDDRLGDVVDEVAASRGRRGGRAPRSRSRGCASSWSAIRLGVKPRWKSALILSCLGGSIPMNIAAGELQREDLARRRVDAAEFRGVGLPVAADLVDVVGGGHRPEAGLLADTARSSRSSGPGTGSAAGGRSPAAGPAGSSRGPPPGSDLAVSAAAGRLCSRLLLHDPQELPTGSVTDERGSVQGVKRRRPPGVRYVQSSTSGTRRSQP